MSVPSLRWLPPSRALIGVVHLEPLPGAPRFGGSLGEVIARAVKDARAWEEGGADGVIVENFGDAPFFAGSVPPETVASMTAAASAVGGEVGIPLGVNVLRNDGEAALAVAVASGARFIRVNVLAHAYVTDQGIIEGRAATLLRKRAFLGADVSILADLLVKHAAPLAPIRGADAARDLAGRAGADGLIVTGSATGRPPSPEEVVEAAEAGTGAPIFVGSGLNPGNAAALLGPARGALVGTWCEREGRIDAERVREIARAVHGQTG
ncbi:MAG: BtpA/SgcQ family protein [Candidatus Eisenbacteria bacterium]